MKDKIKGKEKYLKRVRFPKPVSKSKKVFVFDGSKNRQPILTMEDSVRYDEERKQAKIERQKKKAG